MSASNGTLSKAERVIAAKRTKGFALHCPQCGEKAAMNLDLSDLSTVTCESCGDSFAVSTAIKMLAERLAQWQRVAQWIDLASDLAVPTTPESE
jgi:hypothetical protein